MRVDAYDPDESRDEHGRWGSGGSSVDLNEFVKLGNKISKNAWGGTTCVGACAATAYALYRRLKVSGQDAHFVVGSWDKGGNPRWDIHNQHAWVESKGKIIDVTHNQYDKTHPIVVAAKDDPRYSQRKKDTKAFQYVMHNWDPEFRPTKRVYSAANFVVDAPWVFDAARRSVNPTGTTKLHKAFRAAADMQLNGLKATLRQAVIDFNVLGLSGPSNYTFMAPAARLNQFAGWLETAANASLDARWWVHPWLDRATQHGLKSAQQELQGVDYQPIPTTFEALHQLAHHELRGVIAALVQKVVRQAHSAAARRLVPHMAYRELIKSIDSDIRNRLHAFAQVMTVKGHVHGKVAYYRQAGITHVGINPELRNPIRHDHLVRDQDEEVAWETAGDEDVCDDCEEMADGSPYTLDEIEDLIPLHVNCRCELVIWEEYGDSAIVDADVEFIQDPSTGRFAGSIGKGQTSQLSHHYSSKAELRGDTVYTPNVYDATRALYEGRNVVLKQPKQVATLVKHLGQVSARMVEMGGKAPNFDLCHVAIKGTNLFCADTKGIPRIKMPQMSKLQTRAFVAHLIEQGYGVENTKEKASHLKATQNQLVGAKVAANAQRMKVDEKYRNRRIVISKDDYILDGHHKWAALLSLDAKNNRLGDLKMRVSRVNIDIISLLRLAHKFTGGKGAKTGDSTQDGFDPDEERDWHGRWGSGGEGSSVVAFHGTTEEVSQKIIKEGIKVSKWGGRTFKNSEADLYAGPRGESVYVANKLASAIDWAQRRSDEGYNHSVGKTQYDLVVFKLDIPKDQWAKFKWDEVAIFGAARAELDIPPAWIVKATGYDAFDVDGENPHDIPLHDANHVVRYMAILVTHHRSHDAFDPDEPRNEKGEWSSEGGGGATGHIELTLVKYGFKRDPKKEWGGNRYYVAEGKAMIFGADGNWAYHKAGFGWKGSMAVVASGKSLTDMVDYLDDEKAGVNFFHGTSSEAVDSIMKNGLSSGVNTGADEWAKRNNRDVYKYTTGDRALSVFMSNNQHDARTYAIYASQMHPGSKQVILSIKVPADQLKNIKIDEHGGGGIEIATPAGSASLEAENSGFRFEGHIPPEWIVRATTRDSENIDRTIYAVILVKDRSVHNAVDR